MEENTKLSSFAVAVKPIKQDHLEGFLLNICGQEYKAWKYDVYIYDAIEIAKKWKPEEVTYERISHLRYWIRENDQHGHNHYLGGIRTLTDTKDAIDELIKAEFRQYDEEDIHKNIRASELKRNAEIFSNPKKSIKQKI